MNGCNRDFRQLSGRVGGSGNFRLANHSGSDEIFVNTSALIGTTLITLGPDNVTLKALGNKDGYDSDSAVEIARLTSSIDFECLRLLPGMAQTLASWLRGQALNDVRRTGRKPTTPPAPLVSMTYSRS